MEFKYTTIPSTIPSNVSGFGKSAVLPLSTFCDKGLDNYSKFCYNSHRNRSLVFKTRLISSRAFSKVGLSPKISPRNNTVENRLINSRELATILNISPSTLWRGVKQGAIPAPVKITSNTT